MEQFLQNLVQSSPFAAALVVVVWLTYRKVENSEKHVQEIINKFVGYIQQRDDNAQKSAMEMEARHTAALKGEQDGFKELAREMISAFRK